MSHYRYHVFLCTNQREDGRQCCGQEGAGAVRAHLGRRAKELGLAGRGGVRISSAGCLGRCADGPVMVVYPDGVWYRYADEADAEEILREHLQQGRTVERLEVPD